MKTNRNRFALCFALDAINLDRRLTKTDDYKNYHWQWRMLGGRRGQCWRCDWATSDRLWFRLIFKIIAVSEKVGPKFDPVRCQNNNYPAEMMRLPSIAHQHLTNGHANWNGICVSFVVIFLKLLSQVQFDFMSMCSTFRDAVIEQINEIFMNILLCCWEICVPRTKWLVTQRFDSCRSSAIEANVTLIN